MANTIKIRRSATSGATPTTSQLALGELAINTYDGKLFLKKDDGSASVIEVGGGATSSTPRKILLYGKANTGSAASFNGTETRFQLRDENGAIINDIASAYQLLISIDGVVQESNSSASGTDGFYITNNTASGTDIVFLAAPASGADFFGTSVTTANFYVNNISESGSTTTIDGLVKVTGGIQATENVTPTTGSGVEIFKPSSTAGQISAFDRSGSAWMDLILKGKEQIFYANNSEAMRISSDGSVGIGGTATGSFGGINKGVLITGTNAQVGLRVETSHGSSGILEVSAESGGVKFDTRGSGHFRFGSAGDEFLRIDSAGLVGIGTSTLNAQLNVHGAASAQVQFRDNGTGELANAGLRVGWNGSDGQMWLFENAAIRFATNNSERMRVDSSGRILVGTVNTPAGTDAQYSKFVIRGNTINSNGAYLSLGNNKTTANTTSDDNLGLITFNDSDSDAGEYARIVGASDGANGTNDYPGKLVFSTTADGGSSPTERMRLDANGDLKLQHTGKYMLTEGTTNAFSISTNGANGHLEIRDEYNNSSRILINNVGRVGIGTQSPTRTLTVQGDMNLLSGSNIESDSSTGTLRIQGGSTYPGGCILMGGGSGTNDIRFSTTGVSTSVSSTEDMRIDSSGRLLVNATGVGSKSAPAPVQIKASTSGAFALSLRNRSNNDYSFLTFTDTGATEDLCQIGTYRSGGSTGSLLFYTNSGNSSGSEKMRILSGGGVTFNGDTAQANALDDYEEGSWTPTLSKTASGAAIGSYSTRLGSYTKIGNLLFISFYIHIHSGSYGSGTGNWIVTGLPYNLKTLTSAAYQSIPGNYMGLNGTNYNFSTATAGGGTASGTRWQANSGGGAASLSMYGVTHGINWTSGALEFSASGTLLVA